VTNHSVYEQRALERAKLADAALSANRAVGRTVAIAESCTGGMVCSALTDIPGCSDVFSAGFITYSDEAKQRQLGVSSEIIETFGAVAIATAWAMVNGVLANSDADVAVSITGLAGPDGGSDKKPVGLVVFCRGHRGQDADEFFTQRVQFESNDRATIRHHAALFALDLLQPARDSLRPSEDITRPAP
jgi:nicotinamide-nucleotide amidase